MKFVSLAFLTLLLATISAWSLCEYQTSCQVRVCLERAQQAVERAQADRMNLARARADYREAVALTQMAFEKSRGLGLHTGECRALQQLAAAYQAQCDALTIPAVEMPPTYLLPLIEKASSTYGVDERLITAIMLQESKYDTYALSVLGAQGLLQLMPDTGRHYGLKNPYDPEENLLAGTHLFKDLMNRFQGNVVLALAAFNAGPEAVEKHQGMPPYPETHNYVQNIMHTYRVLGGTE